MKHTEKKEELVESTYYTCDVCGARKESVYYQEIVCCDGCGIHMCSNCRTMSPMELYEDFGDYSEWACKKCRDIFAEGKFYEKMTKFTNERESLYDRECAVTQEWRDECRKRLTKAE